MQGKTVLITGATAGIGRVTAHELADDGAKVVFVARNQVKAEATRAWIEQSTGNSSVEYLIADLSVQKQVRATAALFASRFEGLDVLVNNVGGFFPKRIETADGVEMTFALNHLTPFLLTNLLIDSLRQKPASRVVTVSSGAHVGSTMRFDDLEGKRRYSGWSAYGQSKLGNLLFTYELSRRLSGAGITVNALHPGFVATDFGKSDGSFMGVMMRIAQKLGAISPEKGALTSIYLASSAEVQGLTGKYFTKCKEVPSSPASMDRDSMRRLWELSCSMTGLPAAD
jgi:NAD(P)-dependent dehydrogenase (short-subunit alcohol dehydrogenase family)